MVSRGDRSFSPVCGPGPQGARVIASAAACGAVILYSGEGAAGPELVDAVGGADEAGLGEHDELSPVAYRELHHRSVDMRRC
jgi:hypothetical protein